MCRFEIPPESRHLLLLQRTKYQKGISYKIFRKIRLRSLYDKYLISYLDTNSQDELADKYYRDLKDEYERMKDYLPKSANNVLDIGCGLGGINIFLNKYYSGNTQIYVLDKNDLTSIYYGFNKEAAIYNSLYTTETFLNKNGVRDNLETIDINHEEYPRAVKFDLIISLLSWGFHYPIKTYLNEVKQSLGNKGGVILDVRNDTGGIEELRKNFEQLDTITNGMKRTRIFVKSPI